MSDSAHLPPTIRRLQELLEAAEVPRVVEVPSELLLEAIAHVDALGDIVRELDPNDEEDRPVAFGCCDELVTSLRGLLGEQPESDIAYATEPANVEIWARSSEIAGQVYTVLGDLGLPVRDLQAKRINDALWVRAAGTIDPRYPAAAKAGAR